MKDVVFPTHQSPSKNSFSPPQIGIALVGLLALFISSVSHAHVKWFVDPNASAAAEFVPYTFADIEVKAWLFIACLLVSIAIFLDVKLKKLPVLDSGIRHKVIDVFRVLVGISFLLTAYEGNLVAPHLPSHGGLGSLLIVLQASIGIMFIANRLMVYAASMIFVLSFGVLLQHGSVSAFEYCNILGIALFFLFNHMPDEGLRMKLKPYSVDALRIFTGIALIALGVTEKLTGAVLGETFVGQYGWNFMSHLGFEFFSDRLLVLSAGAMEVVFGTIMVLGVVTRLNTLVVACFMITSNVTFVVVDNHNAAMTELIGHMPIIGSALVLLLLGYGQRLKITKKVEWTRKTIVGTAST